MKYIILIVFFLSFPVVALAAHTFDEQKDSKKTSLLQKLQEKADKEGSCNPQKSLHMIPFN